MLLVVGIILRVLIVGFLFWGVMKLFDRDNTRNNLPMAFVMGLALNFGYLGLISSGILLVVYYEMGFWEAILFLVVLFAISWGLSSLLKFLVP